VSRGNSRLPEGWIQATLGDITVPKVKQGAPPESEVFTYIDISGVDNEAKSITDPKELSGSEAPSRARQHVGPGDVLVSMTRPNLNAVAVVPPQYDGAIASTGFDVLRPIQVDPKWVFAHVRSSQFVAAMTRLVQGALYPAVRSDDIRAYEIPIPPLPEQRRIVARIEELQTRTRRAREIVEVVPELLEQFRQAVLSSAFRGDLTAGWRERHPEVEPAATLLEHIRAERRRHWEATELETMRAKGKEPKNERWKQRYKGPEPIDTGELLELPGGWAWSSIDQICHVVRGASPRPAGDPRYFNGQSTPWITVGEITKDEEIFLHTTATCLTDAGRKRSRYIEPGTLLLTNSGVTLGVPKITAIGGCINDGSVALLGLGGELQLYLYYFLASRTKALRAINQGAAQPNLNTDIVRSIRVPVPPQVELREVVGKIRALLSLQGRVMSAAASVSDTVKPLDQALLAKAFRGELVPQDPNDEPASVLLERIREKRDQQRNRGRKP
jgi:type I restriction enzyme S subunit